MTPARKLERKHADSLIAAWRAAFVAGAALPPLPLLVAARLHDEVSRAYMDRELDAETVFRMRPAILASVAPGETCSRAMTVTDGVVCVSEVSAKHSCGVVHNDIHDALVCENERRAKNPPTRSPKSPPLTHAFRGQLVEYADGRSELQVFQRSQHALEHDTFGVSGVERAIPGYVRGCCKSEGVTDFRKLKMHTADVYAKNVVLLKAEMERRAADLMARHGSKLWGHVAYTVHYTTEGRAFGSLEHLVREDAKRAEKNAPAARASRPARARRSSAAPSRARKAA